MTRVVKDNETSGPMSYDYYDETNIMMVYTKHKRIIGT